MAKRISESQYVDMIAKKSGKSRKEVKADLAVQRDVLAKGLKGADSVRTPFGTVKKKVVPAQKGGKKAVNPFTKETYTTKSKPAKTKVRLTPSRSLLDSL